MKLSPATNSTIQLQHMQTDSLLLLLHLGEVNSNGLVGRNVSAISEEPNL